MKYKKRAKKSSGNIRARGFQILKTPQSNWPHRHFLFYSERMGGQTIGSNLGTKTQHISNNKDNLHSTYVSSVQLLGSGTYCWIKEFEPKENRHQKTLKKIGGRDPLLVTDSHKSSGANGRTNVLCFLYDVVSKRAVLFAILDQTTIYYMRLCVKM